MTDNLSIEFYAFAGHILISLSVDKTLLPRYVNSSIDFRQPLFNAEISPFLIKHMYSVYFAFTWRPMLPDAYSRHSSRD